MAIAVIGGTGFIGTRLVEQLTAQGEQVILISRYPDSACRKFPKVFFPKVQIAGYDNWSEMLADCRAVVNLAGSSIAGRRWTAQVKQDILNSRVLTTRKLAEALKHTSPRPAVVVNASAIGYYGTDLQKTFDEYSFAGSGFLAEVCQAWEKEAEAIANLGIRLVKLRIGVVLGYGGALARILPIFRAGVGGIIGSGKQWFSWVHRDDLVNLILFAIANPNLQGAVNGTVPEPVTNAEFTEALAEVLSCPAFLPVPAIALQVLFGEAASIILEGQKVLPLKAQTNGFQFTYPDIRSALKQILQ